MINEVNPYGISQHVGFFAECVREPSEAANLHANIKILTLGIAGRNFVHIKVAGDMDLLSTHALTRAVAVLWTGVIAEPFDQQRIVNIGPEMVVYKKEQTLFQFILHETREQVVETLDEPETEPTPSKPKVVELSDNVTALPEFK